jgi:hypothetical protein
MTIGLLVGVSIGSFFGACWGICTERDRWEPRYPTKRQLREAPLTNNRQRRKRIMKAEGIWPCIVFGANFGEDDKGSPNVQINVKIDDGPSKGQACTYEDQINAKSALYVGRSCKAVGWKGRSLTTLRDDCAAWIAATGGKSTVEIKHIVRKSDGSIWDKVNAIGRGPRVLHAATDERLADADAAMREAMSADGGAPDDAGDPDDIPFATSSMSRDVNPIAAVLR